MILKLKKNYFNMSGKCQQEKGGFATRQSCNSFRNVPFLHFVYGKQNIIVYCHTWLCTKITVIKLHEYMRILFSEVFLSADSLIHEYRISLKGHFLVKMCLLIFKFSIHGLK